MAGLNRVMAEQIVRKLEALPPDRVPAWGTMSVPQVLGHLRAVLMYTMGHFPDMPNKGNWKSRILFKPLIISGIKAIPRGIRMPRPKGVKEMPPPPEASPGELLETLHEYLERYERGELSGRMHPFFGVLSAKQWNKFHVAHFRHHMTQFGVW